MPRLPHDEEAFRRLRIPSVDHPLRILVSGCLAGWGCGTDGSDYGLKPTLAQILALPAAAAFPFCPEQHGLGTPRNMPDIHGGDGFDVLDGRARVLDEHGNDLTAQMLEGATAMLQHARAHGAELAILTDMSAACGSQVISDSCRLVEQRKFHRSVGVATAALLRAGLPVVSQRDHRTVGRLRALMDPTYTPDPAAIDYHECEWYRRQWPG